MVMRTIFVDCVRVEIFNLSFTGCYFEVEQ